MRGACTFAQPVYLYSLFVEKEDLTTRRASLSRRILEKAEGHGEHKGRNE